MGGGGAIQGGLDLLDGGADEAVDGGDGLLVEPGRRQAADEDLERHGDERPRAGAAAAVGEDGEPRGKQRDRRQIGRAHV